MKTLVIKTQMLLAQKKAELAESRDRGATAVEYGLIVALIAVVIIVAVTLLGGALSDIFNEVAQSISAA